MSYRLWIILLAITVSGCDTVLVDVLPILPETLHTERQTQSARVATGKSCATTVLGVFHVGKESTQVALGRAMLAVPETVYLANVTVERSVKFGIFSNDNCVVVSGMAMVEPSHSSKEKKSKGRSTDEEPQDSGDD